MYPWYDRFQMGLVHFMAYPEAKTREEILATIKKVLTDEFFQVIEVSGALDEDCLSEIGRMCEIAKVELIIAAQPVVLARKLNLNSLDDQERTTAVNVMKEIIYKAYKAKAKGIGFLSGRMPETEDTDVIEKAKSQLVLSLKELCEYSKQLSEKFGYTLALNLEIFDWFVDKKALVGPAPIAFEIASKVLSRFQNFGLLIDLSHQPLLYEDPFYTLSLLIPFVKHVHIGNAVLNENHPAYGDLHPRFGVEGGENDVDELVYFLRSLQKLGYFDKKLITRKPVVSFEVKPLPGEDPDLVVANAKRTFLRAYTHLS